MPQANLREYFLNDYKSGGAFEHDAYEHDAADWCWIHKRSGIKARPLQFDAFHTSCCHVVTQFCCRFRPTSSSSSCQVWQDALDLTQSGGSGEVECLFHYTTQLGFWNITAPSKKAVEVFVLHLVWIHVVGATTPAPLRQPQTAWRSQGFPCDRRSEGQCMVGCRQVQQLAPNHYGSSWGVEHGRIGSGAIWQYWTWNPNMCLLFSMDRVIKAFLSTFGISDKASTLSEQLRMNGQMLRCS